VNKYDEFNSNQFACNFIQMFSFKMELNFHIEINSFLSLID
jgi:hypothetical protein